MKTSTRIVGTALALLVALTPLAPRASAARANTAAQQPGQNLQATDALRRGRELLKRGKSDQALPLLETAQRLYTQANSLRGLAATHDALGDLYARQGQFSRAVPHYRDAFEKFAAADKRVESTAATADRLTNTNTASTVAKFDDSDFNANLMLAKTGEALFRAGNVSESGSTYSRMNVKRPGGAVSKVKRFGGFGGFGGLLAGGGSKADIASTAAGVAGSAYSIQQNFEFYRQSILYATYALGLGRVAFHNNQLDAAQKHFQDALDVLGSNLPGIGNVGQIRRFRAAARTGLGDVAIRTNNPSNALKLYTDAAKGAQADKRPDLAWPALRGQGRARLAMAAQERPGQKRQKLQEEAVASYREALQTIETVRQGTVRADEARTTFLATTKDVFDEAVAALAELALASQSAGGNLEGQSLAYAAEAFRVVEQSRARSLLDMLSEGGAEITQGLPADLVKRKQENLERQHEIAQELSGVSLTGEAPKESVGKLEEELEKLATEYDSIENQIRAANPRYGQLTAAQPLTLAEVQQRVLDDGTVLAEYAMGRENSYLWVVTKTTAALYRLPGREQVERQVAEFRDQIVPQSLRRSVIELAGQTRGLGDERGLNLGTTAAAAGNAGPFTKAAHTLYQTILAPAAQLVADKRLLVVADGALNYVPFEALVTAPGGTDYSALPYLIKTNEVVYAPSASVVAAVRAQQGGTQTGTGMLVVADPIFDPTDARAKSAPAAQTADDGARSNFSFAAAVADVTGAKETPAAGFRLARLTGTRTEAEEIGKIARASGITSDVWLDFDASEANVRARDISKYRVVHIATHGLLNTERPQYTGVVLTLVGNRESDGFLRTDEIFNLRLGAQLVVLSACETGLGREKRGEGVIGLTRAFMYAGAPTVGVSLWSVADRSTAELMSDFYKRLLTKQSATTPAALRAAQQQMIGGKRYSAPFYWAPFVLIGDWNSKA
ncbi:MAG TPA: CHAT domain-containing protein [Pyrinomonadaceae bacterium]|nr:CHAT domain-containing protein [Pyrinomonadaceae bacterium]